MLTWAAEVERRLSDLDLGNVPGVEPCAENTCREMRER